MSKVVGGTVIAGMILAGGYVWADLQDLVPGYLTVAPKPEPPAPFPEVAEFETPEVNSSRYQFAPQFDGTVQGATGEATAEINTIVNRFITNPVMGDHVGVLINDLATGETLVTYADGDLYVPASVQKILTATASYQILNPNDTIETAVYQLGVTGVVLEGNGDMMLGPEASDPAVVNGRAGLGDLAEETSKKLKLSGATKIKVYFDDSVFEAEKTPEPWSDPDRNTGYIAPVSALAVNVGKIADAPGPARHADPAAHAATVFAEQLTKRGIIVEAKPQRITNYKKDAELKLASVQSASYQEIIQYFLATSDNTITEVVCRLAAKANGAPVSNAGGVATVKDTLTKNGIDLAGASLADCSGLADGNRLTLKQVADTMQFANTVEANDSKQVLIDLPIAGYQGSLAGRYEDSPARGWVRAKTGSLTGVTALAGTLVTESGRTLSFVVIADRTPEGGQIRPRAAVDQFITELSQCNC